ncbi:hypothetical protein [Pectinatus haikarae]|uniref:Flippase GtrA n=1 Tax=Pectinatus haikarae TaxID=349096 RepID=A0ABT9Y8I3_9FIRM|nr:hypothetical protein [Pectinatus haikarae]MDQ0204157.1 putative flippase GtrA [Pectinatus haikarae]
MKNLTLLFTGITLVGGVILSLISGSWIMLAAAVILMGSSFVISYIGSMLALSGDEAADDAESVVYRRACANK